MGMSKDTNEIILDILKSVLDWNCEMFDKEGTVA